MRLALTLMAFAACLAAQISPPGKDGKPAGNRKDLVKAGWTPLLNGSDLGGWRGQDGKSNTWFTANAVRWDGEITPRLLMAAGEPGSIILNGPTGKTANLVTDRAFGNVELYLEFMLAKDSNSGVYLHGLYEVQIKDS